MVLNALEMCLWGQELWKGGHKMIKIYNVALKSHNRYNI